MHFSRRQKSENDPSVDNSTPPTNDTTNNITTTTTTTTTTTPAHTGVNENEKTAANPDSAIVAALEPSVNTAAAPTAMPNHAHPGSGFGKLGDEEYHLRDVDSRSRDNDITGVGGVANGGIDGDNNSVLEGTAVEYRTYKRRWFGLAQLTLLNIIVSWDVSRKYLLLEFLVESWARVCERIAKSVYGYLHQTSHHRSYSTAHDQQGWRIITSCYLPCTKPPQTHHNLNISMRPK